MAERDNVSIVDDSGDHEDKIIKRLSSKNLNRAMGYLISKARLVFIKLRKAFTKALIFRHFDLEYHIQIKTITSGYVISEVLSQLILDNLGQ